MKKKNLSKVYQIGRYTISFYIKEWKWVAVNNFGFGVDSDDSIAKLKKRIKELRTIELNNKHFKQKTTYHNI